MEDDNKDKDEDEMTIKMMMTMKMIILDEWRIKMMTTRRVKISCAMTNYLVVVTVPQNLSSL